MYSGPGSGPLLAAAGSWDSLAAELDVTVQTYESVLSGLTTLHWHGPASAAMAHTAIPYIGWLHTTAEQTRQSAMQARAAAAAYELAHAMTVPPPAVAANRIQLATLIATNFFGQNTPAIAATEAQYAEYWAQDAAAMYSYADSSAAASELTPFTYPAPTTDPSGLSAQKTAVTQANAGAAAATRPIFSRGGDLSLQSLYTAIDPSSLFYLDVSLLDEIRVVGTAINSSYKISAVDTGIIGAEDNLGILPEAGVQTAAITPAAPAPELARVGSAMRAGLGLRGVTATLAGAGRLGSMSVPASWTMPVNGPASALVTPSPAAGVGSFAATGGPVGSAASGVPGVPGITVSRPSIVVPRYGRRILAVMGRPPAAG